MAKNRIFGKSNYFYLIQQFTITDFKLRYSHSVLGYLWSLLNPLLMFGVLYFVFSVFMRFGGIEHYQIYLLSGILLWGYFSKTTSSGMKSLEMKSHIINKVNFPRIIIPLSSTLTNLLTIILNMIVLVFFIILSRVDVKLSVMYGIVVIIEITIFAFGLSLFLSSLYLKFRDLSHLWSVILQIGFWGTPIIYPIDIVPEKYHMIFVLNPMARFISDFRMVVIAGHMPEVMDVFINFFLGVVVFFIGLLIFDRRQRYFAEWI